MHLLGDIGSVEKCREMGFSYTITFTSKYQIPLKFLEDVQLRFLSLSLEFEHLTRILVNCGSNGLIADGVWKSTGNGILKFHHSHFRRSDSIEIFGGCTAKVPQLIPRV